jgi:hypothetical protein
MIAIYAASDHTGSGRDGELPARINREAVAPDWPGSRKTLWAGRVMSCAAALFLLFDATVKVLELPLAMEANTQLGYPASVVFKLGLLQLACLIMYLVPRTSVLGAVLWTGYLGGAIATHVRVGNPLFSHTLFPTYVAVLLWGGLWLRDERLRSVLPMRAAK